MKIVKIKNEIQLTNYCRTSFIICTVVFSILAIVVITVFPLGLISGSPSIWKQSLFIMLIIFMLALLLAGFSAVYIDHKNAKHRVIRIITNEKMVIKDTLNKTFEYKIGEFQHILAQRVSIGKYSKLNAVLIGRNGGAFIYASGLTISELSEELSLVINELNLRIIESKNTITSSRFTRKYT